MLYLFLATIQTKSMDQLQKRISQIKMALVIDQPYFGSIASTLLPKQNDDISTFASTPEFFEYNDEYLEFLSNEEISFLLTNAAMHQALGYEARKEGRLQWLWTLAQDYTINSLLVNNGLVLPQGLHYDERFEGLSCEAVYKILEDEIDTDKHTPKEVENIRYEKMQDTNEYDQDPIEDIHDQILNKSKMQGDLPLGIELVVPKIKTDTLHWSDELFTIIENSVKFDYNLLPPNKRYLSLGFALPSLSGTKARLVIVVDSSASIDIRQLSRFLQEVETIMNSFTNFHIDLLIADAKVHEHHILEPGDQLSYTTKGGGGTNFEKAFEYIDENIDQVNLCLYFTDGKGTFPKEEPSFDVLWASSSQEGVYPFGRVIFLD